MKRVWGHVLVGLSLAGGGAAAFLACVHNDSTLFVQNVLAPQEVANNMGCVFTSSTSQPVLSSGVLDIDFRLSYSAVFLVGNQMIAEANSAQLMTETSIINIKGAVVRVTKGGSQLTSFTRLFVGTVYPANQGVPGYAPLGVDGIIDSNTIAKDPDIQALAQAPARSGSVRLVAYVRFFGNTLGGKYVESNEFEFPVDVCKGCLIAFSPQDICPAVPAPNCLGQPGAMSSTSQAPIPCVVGQDLPIDCVQCQGTPDCNPNANAPRPDGGCGQ